MSKQADLLDEINMTLARDIIYALTWFDVKTCIHTSSFARPTGAGLVLK